MVTVRSDWKERHFPRRGAEGGAEYPGKLPAVPYPAAASPETAFENATGGEMPLQETPGRNALEWSGSGWPSMLRRQARERRAQRPALISSYISGRTALKSFQLYPPSVAFNQDGIA